MQALGVQPCLLPTVMDLDLFVCCSGFLSLNVVDRRGWIISFLVGGCRSGGCHVHDRKFSSITNVLWGTKLTLVENLQPSHCLGSSTAAMHGALLWESWCRLFRSSSQLESPWTTSPGIYNNSAQDCLSPPPPLIPMIVQCFFSVFSSGNLSFLTRQSQSSEQPSEND